MIEETNFSQLDYIDSLEKLQNCLHLVETALGIDKRKEKTNLEESEEERAKVFEIKRRQITRKDIAEQKRYLAEMRADTEAMFNENLARFTESQARFKNRLKKHGKN
jgi:hypothetical protein